MPNVDVNQVKEDVQIVNVEVEETSQEVPNVDLHLDLGLIDCETKAKAQISDLEDNSVAVGPSYTKKVMDDLDALLADLQSTTANISSYQHSLGQYNQEPNTSSYPQYYRNDGAPEGVDLGPHYQRLDHSRSGQDGRGYLGQEYHAPEDYQQRGTGSVVTVRRNSYNSSGENSGNSTPPPLPPPPPSEILDSIAYGRDQEPIYEQQTFHVRDTTPSSTSDGSEQITSQRAQVKVRGERMSALSNNLSELDQLLQDLNSAQFMAEVDRKSNKIINFLNYLEDQSEEKPKVKEVSVVNGGVAAKQPPPKVAAKPGQRTSVDNLLDELEIVGSQPGRFPTDPHYQELSTVTTNHSQYQREGGPAFIHNSAQSSTTSYAHPQTASTATRELDELMLSLSEFKLQNKPEVDANQEPAYAKPVKKSSTGVSPTSPLGPSPLSQQVPAERHQQFQQQQQYQIQRENGQLESMLGDLQSDMNRQGVNTKQKGVCAACQKSIVGQVIAALGRTWHVEHFVCAHCEVPLGTRNFYERDSLAYCEVDYHQLFAPRCAYCNGPIVDKCITALEKMWHPEHFFCAQCGRLFGEEDFHEKNGKAYCREDYFQMFAPKCGGCAKPIMDNYISALNRQWHPECFVCWECRATFGVGSFFDYEGLPYCETHYHAKKGSLCASCEKPITGRCITAMFKKFHPEHFVCAFCLKQLNKGTFKEQNDKPYCHPCFVKLFG
ncbi:leupaxin-like isoform X1 [Biomphalaria glabrata]|uniref:Leupaxin-like isoform X1 n=1 Tax=Biomphalaria glabrata TaxID=6526 RepID=A0A9U8E6K9_BIOGL|nr:leupaxin-like isoform X1 [Biomphalaria glabrata]